MLKKGSSLVPQEDRRRVVEAVRYVDAAIVSVDSDRTVRETLRRLSAADPRPTHLFVQLDTHPTVHIMLVALRYLVQILCVKALCCDVWFV